MAYNQGSHNLYASFPFECTYWAAERYHELTNIWVPWVGEGVGNAYQWYHGALANGWATSSIAPKGIPSIICLQPNAGQGLAGLGLIYGHVAVVEKVNSDSSVVTSYGHWGVGPIYTTTDQGAVIRTVTFWPNAGVSFLWAADTAKSIKGGFTRGGLAGSAVLNTTIQTAGKLNLTPNATVTQALADIDNYLAMRNPFDVDTSLIQARISVAGQGISFTDPAEWLQVVMNNILIDLISLTIRVILIFLGIMILYKVLSHFVDFAGMQRQAAQTTGKVLQLVAPIAALA